MLGLSGAWQEEVLRLNPLPLLVGIVMKADAEPRQLVRVCSSSEDQASGLVLCRS